MDGGGQAALQDVGRGVGLQSTLLTRAVPTHDRRVPSPTNDFAGAEARAPPQTAGSAHLAANTAPRGLATVCRYSSRPGRQRRYHKIACFSVAGPRRSGAAMADTPRRSLWPETFKRWWLWPLGVLLFLLVVAVTLVLVAQVVYDTGNPRRFLSVLATGVLLNGAVVVILGAIITTVLSIATEIRSRGERAAEKRLELFCRMRDAHVRVALTQEILRSQTEVGTYHEQMGVLLQVVKDMGEIREEVRVSGRLYDDVDRRLIIKGIALIIIYLQEGIDQYVKWSTPADGRRPEARPDYEDAWVVKLVADHDSRRRTRQPEAEDWEPKGQMPAAYDKGLEQSKLIMRAYVYGASRNARAALREEVQQDIAARPAAEEARKPPST